MRKHFWVGLGLWSVLAMARAGATELRTSSDDEGRTVATNVDPATAFALQPTGAPSASQSTRHELRPIVEAAAMRLPRWPDGACTILEHERRTAFAG